MAAGILSQFPDLTQVLDVQVDVSAKFSTATTPLEHPETLTQTLSNGISAVRTVIPADLTTLGKPIAASIASLSGTLETPTIPALQTFESGLADIQSLLAPAKAAFLAEDGHLLDLKSAVFARSGDPEQFINSLLAQFQTIIPLESIQLLQTFIATLQQFEAQIPTDPEAIAEFLARSFLGVPLNLLNQPLGVVNSFHSQIDQLVNPTQLNRFRAQIQQTIVQLTSTTQLLRQFDPRSTNSYETVNATLRTIQTNMGAIVTLLNGLASAFQTRLTALNPAPFLNSLRSTLTNLPAIQVAQANAFIDQVLEPIRFLSQQLDQVTPQQLVEVIGGFNDSLRSIVEEQGFEDIRTELLKPLQDLGGLMANLHLEQLRDGVIAAFDSIRAGVNDIASKIQQVGETLKQIPAKLNQALTALSQTGDQVGSLLNEAIAKVNGVLDGIPLDTFRDQILAAIAAIQDLLHRFQPQLSAAVQQINGLRDQIDKINLRQAAAPAFELMESVEEQLAKIKLSALSEVEASAFRVSASVLLEIDLSPVKQELNHALDQLNPSPLLDSIGQGYQGLLDKIGQYSPEALLTPLEAPFKQMQQALTQLDPAQLLTPLIQELQDLKQDLLGLDLEQVITPLLQPLNEVGQALDAIAPTKLLAPIVAGFESLTGLLDRLDIQPFMQELEGSLSDWIGRAIAALQTTSDSFRNLDWLKPYLEGLDPNSSQLSNLPGMVLKPLETLFNKIIGLLDLVPAAQLLAAFQQLQAQFVNALDALDPNRITTNLGQRLQDTLAQFGLGHQNSLIANLNNAYSDLLLAFDAIDPIQVKAELQTNYNTTAELVIAINPDPVLNPVRASLQSLNQQITEFQTAIDVSTLAPNFASVQTKVSSLIPDFLHAELSLDTLKAQLQTLNPSQLAAQANQEFGQLLAKVNQFGSVLAAELPKFKDTLKTGTGTFLPAIVETLFDYVYAPLRDNQPLTTMLERLHPHPLVTTLLEALRTSATAFFPALLQDAFQAVFAPLKAQLAALNPAPLIAELETVAFQPLRTALNSLDPRSILADLNLSEQLAAWGNTLEGIINSLKQLKGTIAGNWKQILAVVDTINPATLKKPLHDAFAQIQSALKEVDIGGILAALRRSIARIRSDLDKILDEAEQALNKMLNAVPQ
jgi:phage shock protein A